MVSRLIIPLPYKSRRPAAHDYRFPDDLLCDVKVHLPLVVKGHHIWIVLCQAFMPRTHSKIVQDCIRRNRTLVQIQCVRHQVRSGLTCLHLPYRRSPVVSVMPPLGLILLIRAILFQLETNPLDLIQRGNPGAFLSSPVPWPFVARPAEPAGFSIDSPVLNGRLTTGEHVLRRDVAIGRFHWGSKLRAVGQGFGSRLVAVTEPSEKFPSVLPSTADKAPSVAYPGNVLLWLAVLPKARFEPSANVPKTLLRRGSDSLRS
jgi:hypothetical protein